MLRPESLRQVEAMDELVERARTGLREIVDRYAAGEAEVVREYFARSHSREEHIEVLLKQMGREIQARKSIPRVAELARQLGRGVDRHDYQTFLETEAEETKHYVLLADIAEWLHGGPLPPDRLLGYEVVARYNPDLPEHEMYHPLLPEANRNLDVGRDLIAALGYERGYELMHLAEGGGGGAFVEGTRLAGDEFRSRLAAAMRTIVKDELHHGPERIDGYAQQWVRTDVELGQDARWLQAFMAAHLRVRNEIWGHPLSEERLAAIDRGEVAPLAEAVV